MAHRRKSSRTTNLPRSGRALRPPFRVLVALGDPDRERTLLSALASDPDFVIVERCLSADQLLSSVRQQREVDAALVAFDLHRLTEAKLVELAGTGLSLVLLTSDIDGGSEIVSAVVLPLGSEPALVRETLLAAIRGERPDFLPQPTRVEEREGPSDVTGSPDTALAVFAVIGGQGAPGRTTVATNLAAALGAVEPTVLVDADLYAPSIAACLDADPTRNLSMLVHAEPETPRDWERAIAQEVQPLGARSPHGSVLCGVPKPAMRAALSVGFLERLIAELRQCCRYVILDAGPDLLTAEGGLHRVTVRLADQVLLVTTGDVVGLWRARGILNQLQGQLQSDADRVALVINRHDRRHHHGRAEIEWALGVPAAAVVPYDHRAAERALAGQRPLVLEERGRAAQSLLDLAERIHGGEILLPPESVRANQKRWRRLGRTWPFRLRLTRKREEQGGLDGDYAPRVSG